MKKHLYHNWDEYGVTAGYCTDFGGHFRYCNPEDEPNFNRVAMEFGLGTDDMVRLQQTHTDLICPIKHTNGGEGITKNEIAKSYDGVITDEKEIMLCVVTADCTPVFLCDPINGVVAMVHSGRAGTMKDIAGKAVDKMESEYGSKPENIRCILGPYICQKHHEVEKKDIEGFYYNYSDGECEKILLKSGEKYYVDMGAAIRFSLRGRGLLDEYITDNHVCTYENADLFSWRRDHNPDARILSFIFMKKIASFKSINTIYKNHVEFLLDIQ